MSNGFVVEEKFVSRNKPASNSGYYPLGKYSEETGSQLDPYLVLLMAGERINYAVYGLGGVVGVESGENQMPGFRRGDRGGDSLRLAHLSYHNHVDIFSESGLERGVKICRVYAYLSLADDGFVGRIDMLNRVLNSHYVAGLFVVNEVNHSGQGSGFTLTHRPHHKKKSLSFFGQFSKNGRKRDLRYIPDFRPQPKGRGDKAFLE